MPFNKYYTNSPSYPAKNNYYGNTPHKPRIKRTYGWDCPFQDYCSNKHYNTQRHINLIHGNGEPIDHLTGETRQQKRNAAVQTFNQSSNMPMYPKTIAQPLTYPEPRYMPMGYNPNAIRLPSLEAAERRVKELGYPIPAQSPYHEQHIGGPAGFSSYSIGANFQYPHKKLPYRRG